MSSATPSIAESQLRRARADLEESLRSSTETRAEALLVEYPAVAADTEAALELVYTEFVLREQLGQTPDPEDWYRRFPQWKTDLEQMFEVHHELKREVVQRQSRVSTSIHPVVSDGSTSRRIGEFEILTELGRGGMGVVYKARQPSLGRVVALKVILSGSHAGERERARFRREAETAAKLDHSNIVRIYELGEHDGRPFCAMEFVDGTPLADLLTGSPWPTRKAAELMATVALAAQHAHENGVIHRDLKPANILLAGARREGSADRTVSDLSSAARGSTPNPPAVKIVDFGLAKTLTDTNPGPTRTGDIIGTPTYMAPEQADAATSLIGPATDVWAMGATLYELLVGHPPFQGGTSVETLQQVRGTEPVSPRRLRPTLPRDLEVICLKCLRKKPADRYRSAAALADDLNRWLRGEPIRARPVTVAEHLTQWCRRNPTIAGLSVAAVLLATAAAVLAVIAVVNLNTARTNADKLVAQEREAKTEQAELRLAELRRAVQLQVNEGIRLLNDGDFAGGALLLTDAMGKDPDPESEEVHRIRLGTTFRAIPALRQVFRVPTRQDQFLPAKSEDGSIQLTYTPGGDEPLVSPDASTLLPIRRGTPKVFWDTTTGASRSVELRDQAAADSLVALSSNGRAVVGLRAATTVAWDTTTGQPLPLPLATEYGTLPPPFTPDGSRRLANGSTPNELQMLAADGQPAGKPMAHTGSIRCSQLGANGTRVATGSADRTARVWDAATGEPITRPLELGEVVSKLALSADGLLVTGYGADGMLQTWEVPSGKPLGYRFQHSGGIIPPQYNPVRPQVATAGWDYGLRLWDAKQGRSVNPPTPDTTPIVAFAFNPKGETVVVVDQSRTARVWEPTSSTPLSPKLYSGERLLARYTADGERLVTLTTCGDVRVWDAPPLFPKRAIRHTRPAYSAEFLPNDDRVFSLGNDGVTFSAPADGKKLRHFPHASCAGMAVRYADPPVLATRDSNGGVLLWSLTTGQRADVRIDSPSPVRAMAFTPDGLLATGGEDGVVRFWNPGTGAATATTLRHGTAINSLAVTLDGTRVLIGSFEKFATLWELPTGRRKRTIPLMRPGPLPAFTPDGRHLAVSSDTTITLLSSADGTTRGRTFDVGLWTERPTFSGDGKYLATANQGAKSIAVWDVETGKPVGSPFVYPERRGENSTPRFAFSGDGKYLACGGNSFVVVWEVATGTQITAPIPNRYANEVKFSADARTLLVASGDTTVRTIDLSPDARPAEQLAELASLYANRTLDDRGALRPAEPAEVQRLWKWFQSLGKP